MSSPGGGGGGGGDGDDGGRSASASVERYGFIAILLVTVALSSSSLALGFYADDYVLRAELGGTFPMSVSWWDLYRFVPGTLEGNRAAMAVGGLPWWAAPELRLHLVRPLASALFALDRALFTSAPLGYHLHSIAWALAMVAAARLVLRRVLPGPTGTLALFLFAVNEGHAFTYGWISGRHLSIAATFALIAIYAFVRDREDGWRAGRWIAALALSAGLAGGETALGAVAYATMHVVFTPARASRDGDARARDSRVAAAAPSLVVLALYVVAYRVVGGGAAHGGGYVDPISDPWGFLTVSVKRLPILLGDAVLAVPAEISNAVPNAPLIALGVVAAAFVAWLYRACSSSVPRSERAVLRWLVPGALLALVVGLGGFPGARVRLMSDVGIAALFAVILRNGFRSRKDGGAPLVFRRAGAGLLALVHVVVAPLALVANLRVNVGVARDVDAIAAEARRALNAPPAKRVFVIGASDPMVMIYPAAVLEAESPGVVSCWSVLSAAKTSHRVTRLDASTVLVEPLGITLLNGAFETLYRSPREPMHVGDTSSQCGATYRVTAVMGGKPTAFEVHLERPLDDDDEVRWLSWQTGADDARLRRFELPRVGESVEVPWSKGPIGLF